MSVTQLPLVPQLNVILSLTPEELLNYCQSSKEALFTCTLSEYVNPYMAQFGIGPEQIPGNTLQKKLGFLAGFNWGVVPGDTPQEKGRFINQIIETAERLDPRVSEIANLGQRLAGHTFQINPQFSRALDEAVQTGYPLFVNYILNTLIEKVGLQNIVFYMHSFRNPLLNSLSHPWNQIVDLLLKHYDARSDELLLIITHEEIRAGNLPAVKSLSRIFPPDEEKFWIAVENGRLAVAQFYWDTLLSDGIDPVSNTHNVYSTYWNAIHDNDRPTIDVLSTFVKPNQAVIQVAERLGNVQMVALLREKCHSTPPCPTVECDLESDS